MLRDYRKPESKIIITFSIYGRNKSALFHVMAWRCWVSNITWTNGDQHLHHSMTSQGHDEFTFELLNCSYKHTQIRIVHVITYRLLQSIHTRVIRQSKYLCFTPFVFICLDNLIDISDRQHYIRGSELTSTTAWISKHMLSKLWDKLFIHGYTIPLTLYNGSKYFFTLGLKSIHVGKGSPRSYGMVKNSLCLEKSELHHVIKWLLLDICQIYPLGRRWRINHSTWHRGCLRYSDMIRVRGAVQHCK